MISVFRISLIAFLVTSTWARSPEESDFVAWFLSNRGYIDGIDIFHFDPMGRGFVALRDLPVNTSVLRIPPKLIISRKMMAASKDPTVKSLMHNLDAESAVKAWLLWEKSLADQSFFAPYIAILPPYVPSLLHFADASLQELDDEKFAAEVRRYQERIASEHMAVAEVWRSAGIRKELSLSDYVWATTIFDSRGLRFKGEVHLAPMADMFNYAPHEMSRQASSGEFFLEHHALSSAGGLSITADRDTKMGEQLFEDYGDNTDEIYLKYHGFVAEVNPFRCVRIDGSLSFEVLLIQGSGEVQSGVAGKSVLPRYTSDLLEVMGLHDAPSRCIDTPGQLGKKLEVFFVILALNEAEAVDCAKSIAQYPNDWGKIFRVCPYNSMISFLQSESLATFAHPHKDSLKNRVLSVVRETIESSVKGYRTTIEQDIEKIHALQTALRACSGMAPQQQHGSVDSSASESEPVSEAEEELGLSIAACDESISAGPITEKMHSLMAVRYRMYLKLHWLAVCEHYGAHCEQSLRSAQSGAGAGTGTGTGTQSETGGGSGPGSGAGSAAVANAESIPMNTDWEIYRELDRKGLLEPERDSAAVANALKVGHGSATMSLVDESASSDVADLSIKVATFNAWVKAQEFHPLKLEAAVIPGFRIGTVALQSVESGDTYLGVPVSVIMDSEKAFTKGVSPVHSLIQALHEKYNGRDDFHELLFFLLHEYFVAKENSFFWPYLALLPDRDQLDIPLFWQKAEVDLRLASSDLRESVLSYQQKTRKMFDGVSKIDVVASFFPADVLSFPNYRWATAILDSRSIWWDGKRHLVPMLDLVNCRENETFPERVHSTKLDEGGKYAITKAGVDYSSGDQVFENYGQPNHIYFHYHGFSLFNPADTGSLSEQPMNTHDCVHVVLQLSDAEKGRIDWEKANTIASRLGLSRSHSMAACLAHPVPPQIWVFISLQMNNFLELQAKGLLGKPTREAADVLIAEIDRRLEKYRKVSTGHAATDRFLGSEAATYRRTKGQLEQSLAALPHLSPEAPPPTPPTNLQERPRVKSPAPSRSRSPSQRGSTRTAASSSTTAAAVAEGSEDHYEDSDNAHEEL